MADYVKPANDVRGDPIRSFLLSIADEVDRLRQYDQHVVFRAPEPPPEHTVRLMRTLGVPIEITPVSAMTPTYVPLYCPHKGCQWSAQRGGSRAHADLDVHLRVVHKGDDPRTKTVAAAPPPPAATNGATALAVAAEQAPRPPKKGRPFRVSRDDVLEALRAQATQPDGKVLSKSQWHARRLRPSITTISRHFVTYAAACEAAGVAAPPPLRDVKIGPPKTEEEAIAALQTFAAEIGETPTSVRWKKERRKPAKQVYYRLFGSWGAACEAAGLTPAISAPSGRPRTKEPVVLPAERVSPPVPATAENRVDALIALARIEGLASATQMNYLRRSDEMALVLKTAQDALRGSL